MKDQKPATTGTAAASTAKSASTPGKGTLVQRRYGGQGARPRGTGSVGDVAATVQAKLGAGDPNGSSGAGDALASLPSGGGQALDAGIQRKVEGATGTGLGDVRVHTGAASAHAAEAIGARAFTMGSDIHLGSGESASDTHLMAHEATHTLHQQGGGGAQAKSEFSVSQPGDALEQEADRVADAAVSGGAAPVSIGAAAAVQREVVDDIREKLSYSAFDWVITDAEASECLQLLNGLGQEELIAVLGQLEQEYKTRLIDNLPEGARGTSAFTRILCAMGPDAVLPYVQGLLSYGIFDWAITDHDVATVFQVMSTLGVEQAILLYQRLSVDFRNRLHDNMPRGSALPPNMRSMIAALVERDAVDIAEAKKLFEIRFRHPLTDGSAAWTMEKIKLVWRQLDALPDADVTENQVWSAIEAISGSGGFYIGTGIQIGVEAGDQHLSHTVRHEVGHGVHDQISGVVNSWLQGSIDFWMIDFDTWITELGGYPATYVHPTDGEKPFDDAAKAAVRNIVESYTNSGDWNPTRATPETGLSDVDLAYWNAMPEPVKNACTQSVAYWYSNWQNFQQVNGRSYFLNHWYHQPFRFGATAAEAIGATGDDYTAMSEKEFFANCYAEYFEDPAGVSDRTKWGGSLPGAVKDFFSACVVDRQPYDEFQQSQATSKTS